MTRRDVLLYASLAAVVIFSSIGLVIWAALSGSTVQ